MSNILLIVKRKLGKRYVFIFNETILLEPLFPTYTVRVAFNPNLNKPHI